MRLRRSAETEGTPSQHPPVDHRERSDSWARWLVGAASGGVVLAVTVYRLGAARSARYPGHADPAFFYNVAQNLRSGRGASIDYVWHFLAPQPPLHHYAFDYWLPLPSVLMSMALRVHPNLDSALAMNLAMTLLIAAGTYLVARMLTGSWWIPPAASALVVLQPTVSAYAVTTESAVYLAGFATLAMAAAIGARNRPWLWAVAGVLGGLAGLARSEGLLLGIVMAIAAFSWPAPGRRAMSVGLLAIGYLVAEAPSLVVSMQHFGTPLPPAAAKFPFITNYEDLFSVHVHASAKALIGGSAGQFLRRRLNAAEEQISGVWGAFPPVNALIMAVLLGGGLHALRRGDQPAEGLKAWSVRWVRSAWFVPTAFVALIFCFDATVAPVVSGAGAFSKSVPAMLPIIFIGALLQLQRLRLRVWYGAFACVLLAFTALLDLPTTTRSTIHRNNQIGEGAVALKSVLAAEQRCIGRPMVLMTRNPWETTQATGFPTVQIPNDALADIVSVAKKYRVTDVLLSSSRRALRDAVARRASSSPFARSSVVGSRPIYRVTAVAGRHPC